MIRDHTSRLLETYPDVLKTTNPVNTKNIKYEHDPCCQWVVMPIVAMLSTLTLRPGQSKHTLQTILSKTVKPSTWTNSLTYFDHQKRLLGRCHWPWIPASCDLGTVSSTYSFKVQCNEISWAIVSFKLPGQSLVSHSASGQSAMIGCPTMPWGSNELVKRSSDFRVYRSAPARLLVSVPLPHQHIFSSIFTSYSFT